MKLGSLAVASRSFSKHPVLRKEVLRRYPDAKFNDEGLSLKDGPLVNFLRRVRESNHRPRKD